MKRLFYILTISLLTLNCQKDLNSENPVIVGRTLATLTTSCVSSITNTTAASGGNISSDGGTIITARGICWSTSPNPVISGNHTTDGAGAGIFSSNMTGLSAVTVYYVRAYSTNSEGTAYGNEITFTTTSSSTALATLTTSDVIQLTSTTVSSGANISNDGGAPITARGVCWSTVTNPSNNGNYTTDGIGIGSFSSNIIGLSSGVQYYVRAYATNSQGTAYGNQINFVNNATAHVYVAGSSAGRCIYWKDGIPTPFTNSGTFNDSRVYSIVVANNDIYVAGYERNVNANRNEAKVWKNAIGILQTNSLGSSFGQAVSVVNNNVYVVGSENTSPNIYTAKVWANGIATTLSSPGFTANANSIFVQNNDIYAGGYEESGVNRHAMIWKNNTPTTLYGFCYQGSNPTCTFDASEVKSIYVAGNDIYAVGTSIAGTGTGVYDSLMWKNGLATRINILPSSIFVSNNDVYISGRAGNYACIWKNGTITRLTNGANQAFANSVFVKGTDVYVAGYEKQPNSVNSIGKLWKNGVATDLTDGTGIAEINSVFVQ